MKCVTIPTTYESTEQGCKNEILCRKRALRDAVLCMGWIRIMAAMFYITVYIFVNANSSGTVPFIIIVMLWTAVPVVMVCAILLFLGAIEDKPLALEVAMWLCLLVAAYNTVLGLVGAVYFIRFGTELIHFFLAAVFGFIMLSILTVVCHDFVIVFSYTQLLKAFECPEACSVTSVNSCCD